MSGVSSEEVNLHETINTMVADIVEKKYLTTNEDPAFEKEYGFKNLSLKLAVEQGTPVYAMRDGIVYYTDTGS